MEPLEIVVTRAGRVEARHRVHAVATADGQLVAEAGEHRLVSYLRSSSKPIQALPLVRARGDLDDRDVAIACASHVALPDQLDAVRRLLAKAPARERELECGVQDGRPRDSLHHNCSGKHAGMLALCRAQGWRSEGYRHEGHRAQRAMAAAHAEAADVDEAAMPTAVDGCGVVTFALDLGRTALAFARLPSLRGAERIVAGMRAHPELVGGPGRPDTELMRALDGWIAKGGAEGLLCAAGPGGLGVAVKVEDGSTRALKPALHAFLGRLGHALPDDFARVDVRNAHGEVVGEIVCGM